MKTISLLVLFTFITLFGALSYAQSDDKLNETVNKITVNKAIVKKPISKVKKRQGPLIIRSQVKGSQEQPNVMYILPWQGIENPIIIEGKSKQIVLPKFQPINPKNFKSQVVLFHQQNNKKTN
jgi:hypothetical protein